MKIDHSNYEAILIDFLDGNLSSQEVDSLMVFLTNNPDIEEELAMIHDMKLEPENIKLNGKSALKRSVILGNDASCFDELCIASLENNLSESDQAFLNAEIKNNPQLKKKFELYQNLRFTPDNSITFKDKDSLRRRKKFFIPKRILYIGTSTLIAIVALIGFLKLHSNNEIDKTLVDKEHITQNKEIIIDSKQKYQNRTLNTTTKTEKHTIEHAEKKEDQEIKQEIVVLEEKQSIDHVSYSESDLQTLNDDSIHTSANTYQLIPEPTSLKNIVNNNAVKKDTAPVVKESDLSSSDNSQTDIIVIPNTKNSPNLIPNASFEEPIDFFYSSNDSSWHKYRKDDTPDYFNFSDEHKMNDVFDTYIGGAKPKDGLAFMGMFCYRTSTEKKYKNIREYIETPLIKTLDKDSLYKFEISICLDKESNIAIKNFSVLFTDHSQEFNNYKLFNSSPQIVFNSFFIDSTESWITLSCEYIAEGYENYIILGNFNSDKDTQVKKLELDSRPNKKTKWKLLKNELASYYYIDKLVLKKR